MPELRESVRAETELSEDSRVQRWVVWVFAVALLTLPLFAHGCHGDDIDHEPVVFPREIDR